MAAKKDTREEFDRLAAVPLSQRTSKQNRRLRLLGNRWENTTEGREQLTAQDERLTQDEVARKRAQRAAADHDASLAEGGLTVTGDETRILLARAQGATLDQLHGAFPGWTREALQRLTDDPQRVAAAYRAAFPDADEPDCLPAAEETLEQKADRLEAEAIRHALQGGEAKQTDVPDGKVPVTIPGSGPGVPATVIHMTTVDYNELRRLRGEGVSLLELRQRFNLPGQVITAVAGDVDPEQAAKARAREAELRQAGTPAAVLPQPASGDRKPRRRAATLEENLAMVRRVAAGEPAAQVAEDTGFAASTVLATYRWAKRERLLEPADQKGA
jgi:hypothetical protein